jgi:hypothetical protein
MEEAPTGELLDEGKAKRFKVSVRLKSAQVRGIPPLPFSFYNAERGRYDTVFSEPIALSVGGSALVGASDVVSTPTGKPPPAPARTAEGTTAVMSLVGADLSLGDPGRTLRPALMVDRLLPWLAALYLLPLLLLAVAVWRARTRARRGVEEGLRAALLGVEKALEEAGRQPARDGAPAVVAALRALGRQFPETPGDLGALVERVEVTAFNPDASARPLEDGVRQAVLAAARGWVTRPRPAGGAASAVAGAALVALCLGPSLGHAQAVPDGEALARARAAYTRALGQEDRTRRTRGFADAEQGYRALALQHPDAPELHADWGNAALGASDLGHAALAYRRALRLDNTLTRAQLNLTWVRSRAPSWVPRAPDVGAFGLLFFWHHALTIPERHVVGGAAFALFLLLLAPWSTLARRNRLLRRLGVIPFLAWLAMASSLALEGNPARDAVVVQEAVLRAADNVRAPAVLASPLPPGTEVTVAESRDGWSRVTLADGTGGWLQPSAVERVAP